MGVSTPVAFALEHGVGVPHAVHMQSLLGW